MTPGQPPRNDGAVTAALDQLCSPGQLDHVLELMPDRLTALLAEVHRAG